MGKIDDCGTEGLIEVRVSPFAVPQLTFAQVRIKQGFYHAGSWFIKINPYEGMSCHNLATFTFPRNTLVEKTAKPVIVME